jgi:hypothetical protein
VVPGIAQIDSNRTIRNRTIKPKNQELTLRAVCGNLLPNAMRK